MGFGSNSAVVPDKRKRRSGTHNHRIVFGEDSELPISCHDDVLWLWVPDQRSASLRFSGTTPSCGCATSSPRAQFCAIELLLDPVEGVVADHLGGTEIEDRFAGGLDGAAAQGIGGQFAIGDAAA